MDKVFKAECDLEEFKIVYDEDALRKEIKGHMMTEEEFEGEGYFVKIGTEDKLTYEEYVQEVNDFEAAFESNITDIMLRNAISSAPKKKNGTFKKNSVIAIKRLNASYYSEDEYGWPCEELRFKAVDDNTLRMSIARTVIKY
jgi:hypothetical protein